MTMLGHRVLSLGWPVASAGARDDTSAGLPGDAGEFDRWVSQQYEVVYRFLLARTCHEDDARDLTQETFIKAYRSRARYRAGQPLRPWLLTIALNCQRDFLRRRRRAEAALASLPIPAPALDNTLAVEIAGAFPRLTEEQRLVMHLRVAEQLSFDEIARIVGCSEAAAKMRVQRARRRLAKLLGKELAPDD